MAKKNEIFLVEDASAPLLVEEQAETSSNKATKSQRKSPSAATTKQVKKKAVAKKEDEESRKLAEAAEKRAQEAERRALEAERRIKEAERKAKAAEAATQAAAQAQTQTAAPQPVKVTEFAYTSQFAQELAKTFEEISDSTKDQKTKWKKMADALTAFPVPNTKGELFTFAVSMQSKMGERLGGEMLSKERETGAMLMTAYLNKYKECIVKAKALFPADSAFANLYSTYEADIRRAKRAIWWQRDHFMLWLILFLVADMLVLFLIGD